MSVITVRENEYYRVRKDSVFAKYFLEGKNKFGRWCIMQSLDNSGLDKIWQQAEQKSEELKNVNQK